MRNMSFAMTTAQMYAGTKFVTRRYGWWNLQVGSELMAVEKGMGLKKGETVVRIRPIIIIDVRKESLLRLFDDDYGPEELELEGFPGMNPVDFVRMVNPKGKPDQINRIEFALLELVDAIAD